MATLGLILATAVWGWTFVLVKDALAEVGPFGFLAVRFAMASALALPFLRRPQAWTTRNWLEGLLLGVVLFAGYFFQTWGLVYTTAQKSGLITGLSVVVVPLFAWALGSRPSLRTWLGVALAGPGVALLALGGEGWAGGSAFGDFLTVVCALAFALYLVLLERYVRAGDPWALLLPQLLTVATLSLMGSAATENLAFRFSGQVWGAVVITAVLATTGAFGILSWAERRVPATRAALILALEPVFAALCGWWLLGEVLRGLQVVGGILIFLGILAHSVQGRPAREPTVDLR